MQNIGVGSDWQAILEHEFQANEELIKFEASFIFQLRCYGKWDKIAHLYLFKAMIECCKSHEGQTHIERWIAQGFDYLDFYPAQEFKDADEDYYVNAIVNFNHLTWWLFSGEGRRDDEFEPI